MEQPSAVDTTQNNTKSPLESRTVVVNVVALLGAIVAKFYPPVGDWLQQNSEAVIGLVSLLSIYGRQQADQQLDWKNMTVKGFGIKF